MELDIKTCPTGQGYYVNDFEQELRFPFGIQLTVDSWPVDLPASSDEIESASGVLQPWQQLPLGATDG